MSTQGKTAAQGGSIDVYDMNRIKKSMDIGRNKMVTLALLCGCDYCPDGVEGIGRDSALKLFDLYADNEILDK